MNLDEKRNVAVLNAIGNHYAIISFKLDGTINYANEKFLKLFGYELNDIVGKYHKIFCDKDYSNSDEYKQFWRDLTAGKVQSGAFKRVKKNNESIFIQASYQPIMNQSGEICEILKFAEDITQRKLYYSNFERQIEAINKSQAIIEFDMQGIILKANKNFLESMGYTIDEIIGKHHNIFCDKKYSNSQEYKEFWNRLNEGLFDTGKYLRIGKNGKKVWIQATYTPILNLDEKPIKVVKFAQDITQFEAVKKDYLTNLYNREKLILDLENNHQNNLAIIDIDDFSSINDFYGHEIGDELILKFSKVLKKLLNEDFTVYRIYADKFAILNKTLSNINFVSYISNINEEIKKLSFDLKIKKFDIVTTCGISFENSDKVLNTAEICNKQAKKILKNVLVYSKELNIEKEFEENIFWAEKIKYALKDNRIIVHFQEIFNNKEQKIEKYEALVRLKDEHGNIIYPNKFLDIAKKSKQYLDITKEVIKKSFDIFRDNSFEFSINLTVEDILDEELKEFLISKIKEYNIGNRLVLELVESEKITTYEPIYNFINEIKTYGCKIAIDDFGSGYSNFEYLVKIDANYVKIDGSIIKRILEDENALEIVKSIITFSKKMGIKIIAEFISSQELFEKVTELEIEFSQGFHIGKPREWSY